MPEPSAMDMEFGLMASAHLAAFRRRWEKRVAGPVLEVGPEHGVYAGADTIDLKPGGTWQGDITEHTMMPTGYYRTVVATGVLEHTTDPFAAVRELDRVLRKPGLVLASAPWNFRIHGPVPDLWRFNQNTWRLLLKNFVIEEMDVLDTPGRQLMPLHICVAARTGKYRRAQDLAFGKIDR